MNESILKKLLIPAFLVAFVANILWAGGNADDFAFEPVSGRSHWTYTVDLEELDEGKHNLVIRSIDSAGNVRIEGPYDFRVDPETDIPSVAVAHPQPGDRVGRMLPIIGTARDDDGIGRVEVSVNEGSWRPASGKEAWSAVLDAAALGDGPHTFSVRSFDVNGLEGESITVPFVVDTSVPVGGVSDPVSGARISGKTSFSGSLQDPNGIEALELSRDGGESWERLKFSRDKDRLTATFDIDLDSRKLDDGPVVWWFRGIDSQKSLAEVPFLFFVDNLGPEISLELPVRRAGENDSAERGRDARKANDYPDIEPVPGNVFLAGTVTDSSGIDSLRLIAGKDDAIEIPLEPGNPWFTWPLNLSGRREKQVDLIIEAVDSAGNSSQEKFRIPIDVNADKPLLSVDSPDRFPDLIFPESGAYLTGIFTDDDGAGSIHWSSGDLEGMLDPVERAWRLDLPNLPSGEVEIALTPQDRFGLSGETVELSFSVAPAPPLIALDSISTSGNAEPDDWIPGLRVPYSGAVISGSVSSAAGKDLTLVYSEGASEERNLSLKADPENPDRRTFQIPVKKGSASGVHNFILRAGDAYGNESLLGSAYYVEPEPDAEGNITDPRLGDQTVNIPLPQLRESDGAAVVRFGQPLQGWTSGASAAGARIEPENDFVRLNTSGDAFYIEAVKEGLSEPFQVVLPDGSRSESLVVLTDTEGPRWEIDTPEPGFWTAGIFTVSGTVIDAAAVASAEWGFDGASFKPVDLDDKGDGKFAFSFDANLQSRPDGPVLLLLRAVDSAGNRSVYEFPVVLDSTPPNLVLSLPPAGLSIGAQSTLVYEVSGDEFIEELSLSLDGETWVQADGSSLYTLNLDLVGYSELPGTLTVRAIDRAGNRSEQSPRLSYDPVSDKPRTFIQTPVDQSVVRGPTDISGLVSDNDAITAINWRIDGGPWKVLTGDASFRIALPLESLDDGTHILEAFAEDAAGNIGDIDSSTFSVTRREAEVAMLNPAVGTVSRGVTTIDGTARDANGIAEVWVSFDNGNTYQRAEGRTDFDAVLVSDGSSEGESETDTVSPAPEADSDLQAGEEELLQAGETGASESLLNRVPGPVVFDEVVNWQYSMDSSLLDDGVHTLLIKVVDGAGDEALLAGLLNIDNRPPLLALGNPQEGSVQSGSMLLEGRVFDDGGIAAFSVRIERSGEILAEYDEPVDGVFHLPFSFEGFDAGEVLLRVEASDMSGNKTAISRSFTVEPERRAVVGNISIPVEGSLVGPFFTLAGTVENAVEGDRALLFIDDVRKEELELDSHGRFFREFTSDELQGGDHLFRVDVVSRGGETIEGTVRRFSYKDSGSWVVLDGYPPGMPIGNRPMLSGRAGYLVEKPSEEDKTLMKTYQRELRENKPDRVEVSLDGGLIFEKAKGTESWEYRIETGDIPDGEIAVLVRAHFPDGWAYTRSLLHLDKSPPDLKLNETIAEGRFNDSIELSGSSSDDRQLESVEVSVRNGSYTLYEVPAFIQGLYFNASAFGATWADAGLGVTFFDDNVKLEVHAGWAPDEVYDRDTDSMVAARVSGIAVGAKLLANVVYLPLGYFFGPNWDRLSFSFAVGANFSYFSNFGLEGGGMMSSVVAQMEIPKIEFPDRKFITYMAPYLEGQLWFFSSDVSTTPFFTASVGLRLGLL